MRDENWVYRDDVTISKSFEKMMPSNCPVKEYTADNVYVGECNFFLENGTTCPRHGTIRHARLDEQDKA